MRVHGNTGDLEVFLLQGKDANVTPARAHGQPGQTMGVSFRGAGATRGVPFARLTTCCAPRKVASSSISFQGSDTAPGNGMYT